MKMTIPWYQECLKNSTNSVSRDFESCMNKFAWVMRNKCENDFRRMQIEEAICQGKDGFDSDKFMKNARLKVKEEAEQRITAQVCQLKAASGVRDSEGGLNRPETRGDEEDSDR